MRVHGLVRCDTMREEGGSILIRNISVIACETAHCHSADHSAAVLVGKM
jgi:hypothetical protein